MRVPFALISSPMKDVVRLVFLLLPVVAVTKHPPSPRERAMALVSKMNFTEQVTLLSGVWGLGWGPAEHPYVGNIRPVARLGVPWLSLQDGPQGYRDGQYGHYKGAPGTTRRRGHPQSPALRTLRLRVRSVFRST